MQSFEDAIAHVRANGTPPVRKSTKIVAGVEIIEWEFPAGSLQISETHEHDHASFLLSGEGLLRVAGEITHLKAPAMVEVKAGAEHQFYAITDCTWDCIWALKGNS